MQAYDDAARKLHAAQAEVDRLEVAVPGVGAADPRLSSQKTGDEADPQIKDLSAQLSAATESLTKTRVTHSAAADEANKALDQRGTFRDRIDKAQGSLKNGSQLSAYLIAAQQRRTPFTS